MDGLSVFASHEDDFAKVFRVKSGRQVVYQLDTNENGAPAVRMTAQVDGIIISMTAGFEDSDEGLDKRNNYFDGLTAVDAEQFEAMGLQATGQ